MPKYPTFPIYTASEPSDQIGRRSLSASVAGNSTGKTTLDLSQNAQDGSMPVVQAVYIDASKLAASQTFALINRQTGQRVAIKGATQGYFQLLAGDMLLFDVEIPNNTVVPLIFTNVEIATAQWPSA